MKKQINNFKTPLSILIVTLLSVVMVMPSWATGPRITEALLSPNKNQIYTNDFPPFATTELATGGFNAEIIDAILKVSSIDAVQTIEPLYSMVKFHLKQEKALAVYGRSFNFSKKENKSLLYIPISISNENFIYYKPAHKAGLSWNGKLNSLKGYTYGAYKGETVKKFKKSGIHIKHGRTHSLIKKLVSQKIDFLSMSDLNLNWELDKKFSNEKNNFTSIKNSNVTKPIFIIFNKKHSKGKSIAKKFKKGLREIIRNGEYLHIVKKYIPEQSAQTKYMKKLKMSLAKYK